METLKYVKWLLVSLVIITFIACGSSSDGGGDNTEKIIAEEPQVELSYPESGEIVVQVIQNNGSANIDYYGNDFDGITEVKGNIGEDALNIILSDNRASQIIIGDNVISITYNEDGTANYILVSADELQFEESNVEVESLVFYSALASSLQRGLTESECSTLKKEMKSMLKSKVLELVGYLKAAEVAYGWPPTTDEERKKLSKELTEVSIKLIIIYPEFHALLMKYREGCFGNIDSQDTSDDVIVEPTIQSILVSNSTSSTFRIVRLSVGIAGDVSPAMTTVPIGEGIHRGYNVTFDVDSDECNMDWIINASYNDTPATSCSETGTIKCGEVNTFMFNNLICR